MVFGWLAKAEPPRPPAEAFTDWRNQALSQKPDDIGISPTSDHPIVWGVIVETGRPESVVTLVALANGATSVYFSNGGSITGAGDHVAVADATLGLISLAQQFHSQMGSATEFPLPALGRVRIYLLTKFGVKTAEASEERLIHGRHSFAPLYHEAYEIIVNVSACTGQGRK